MDMIEIAGIMLLVALALLIIVLPLMVFLAIPLGALIAGLGGGLLGVVAIAIMAAESM